MQNIILLDRDGVINYDSTEYVKSEDELNFIPGSIDAIVQLTQSGYQIGIATNQSGIARGYYDETILANIHKKLLTHTHAAGGNIAAIEYCPHHPDHGCACRKPKPGMLYTLAKRFDCDLSNTPFVGDKISDIQAAQAAGAQPIFITSINNKLNQLVQHEYPQVPMFNSLFDFVQSHIKK